MRLCQSDFSKYFVSLFILSPLTISCTQKNANPDGEVKGRRIVTNEGNTDETSETSYRRIVGPIEIMEEYIKDEGKRTKFLQKMHYIDKIFEPNFRAVLSLIENIDEEKLFQTINFDNVEVIGLGPLGKRLYFKMKNDDLLHFIERSSQSSKIIYRSEIKKDTLSDRMVTLSK